MTVVIRFYSLLFHGAMILRVPVASAWTGTATVTALGPGRTTSQTQLSGKGNARKERSSRLHMAIDNSCESQDRDSRTAQSLSSRRQWLLQTATATITATAALTAALEAPLPASAATVSRPAYCDVAVSAWRNANTNRQVYIVGTAHISSSSAQLAGDLIFDVKPNAVFVELDAKRVGLKPNKAPPTQTSNDALAATSGGYTRTDDNASSKKRIELPVAPDSIVSGPALATTNPSNKSSSNKRSNNNNNNNSNNNDMGAMAIGSAIKSMYGTLGDKGFSPGQEFVVAVQAGRQVGSTIILGDQDVDVTLSRLSQALRRTDFKRLMSADSELETTMRDMLPSNDGKSDPALVNVDDPNFNAELSNYVEIMKAKDNVRLIMKQLQSVAPEVYQAMVAERDEYMANGLNTLSPEYPIIVAVMGMAHTEGVETYLQNHGWMPVKLKC